MRPVPGSSHSIPPPEALPKRPANDPQPLPLHLLTSFSRARSQLALLSQHFPPLSLRPPSVAPTPPPPLFQDALSSLASVGTSAFHTTRKIARGMLYLTLSQRMSTTGFVTFRQMSACATSCQVRCGMRGGERGCFVRESCGEVIMWFPRLNEAAVFYVDAGVV